MKYSGAIVKTATYLMWGKEFASKNVYMDQAGMFDAFNESPFYGDEWTHASKIMHAEDVWYEYCYFPKP